MKRLTKCFTTRWIALVLALVLVLSHLSIGLYADALPIGDRNNSNYAVEADVLVVELNRVDGVLFELTQALDNYNMQFIMLNNRQFELQQEMNDLELQTFFLFEEEEFNFDQFIYNEDRLAALTLELEDITAQLAEQQVSLYELETKIARYNVLRLNVLFEIENAHTAYDPQEFNLENAYEVEEDYDAEEYYDENAYDDEDAEEECEENAYDEEDAEEECEENAYDEEDECDENVYGEYYEILEELFVCECYEYFDECFCEDFGEDVCECDYGECYCNDNSFFIPINPINVHFVHTVQVTTWTQLRNAVRNAGRTPTHVVMTRNIDIGTNSLTIPATATIKLSGPFTLTTRGSGPAVTVNGSFILDGPTITRTGSLASSRRGIRVNNRGVFTMLSGTISNHITGVHVNNGGTVFMSGGTITANRSKCGVGGGAHVTGAKASFTMSGNARIERNLGGRKGAGVMVLAGARFEMSGNASINNNIATGKKTAYGGGVYVRNSQLIMHGGEIVDNVARTTKSFYRKLKIIARGGGVYLSSTGSSRAHFQMNGGRIDGNRADLGGGIYISGQRATFNMTAGQVTNNTAREGGGIYVNPVRRANLNIVSPAAFNGNRATNGHRDYGLSRGLADFPNIRWLGYPTGTNSIPGSHLLNNYDINNTVHRPEEPPVNNTVTFHFYDGTSEYVVIPVELDSPLCPVALAPVMERVNTVQSYAFWGWFTDETLDASGRTRGGHRRPALTDQYGFDVTRVITQAMLDHYGDGYNIDLYAILILWGDVNDSGAVDIIDVNTLLQYIDRVPVTIVRVAAKVTGNPTISILDANLILQYVDRVPGVSLDPRGLSARTFVAASPVWQINNATGASGSYVDVRLQLNQTTPFGMGATQFVLDFDPAVLANPRISPRVSRDSLTPMQQGQYDLLRLWEFDDNFISDFFGAGPGGNHAQHNMHAPTITHGGGWNSGQVSVIWQPSNSVIGSWESGIYVDIRFDVVAASPTVTSVTFAQYGGMTGSWPALHPSGRGGNPTMNWNEQISGSVTVQ